MPTEESRRRAAEAEEAAKRAKFQEMVASLPAPMSNPRPATPYDSLENRWVLTDMWPWMCSLYGDDITDTLPPHLVDDNTRVYASIGPHYEFINGEWYPSTLDKYFAVQQQFAPKRNKEIEHDVGRRVMPQLLSEMYVSDDDDAEPSTI